jgi:hypothetical protein
VNWIKSPEHIYALLLLAGLIASAFPNSAIASRIGLVIRGVVTAHLPTTLLAFRKRAPTIPETPDAKKKAKAMFVVLINYDTSRTDITPAWLEKIAAAFTKDLQTSFCPSYGLDAWACTTDSSLPGPRLAIFGKSDVPGALGYHDVASNGLPYGDAFADGQSLDELSETLSHELKELIGDIWADRWRFALDGKGYAEEACDAVQGSPYRVDGVLCANHVTPAWYEDGSKGPFDHMGVLSSPHSRTDGGYLIVMDHGVVSTEPNMRAISPPAKMAKTRERIQRPNSRTRKRLFAFEQKA